MGIGASVIMPCYNNLHILKITLPEWIAQDWDDYEVIVVDDGSPTDSGIREYVESLGYRYYRQERRAFGMYRACNMGIWHANGDRIVIAGSDVIPFTNLISGHMDVATGDNLTAGAIHYGGTVVGLNCSKEYEEKFPELYHNEVTGHTFRYYRDNREPLNAEPLDIARRFNRIGVGIVGAPNSECIHIIHPASKGHWMEEVLAERENDPPRNAEVPESWR